MQLTIVSVNVIRVRAAENNFGADFSYTVISKTNAPEFIVNDSEEDIRMETDAVTLNISKHPVHLTFLTKQK